MKKFLKVFAVIAVLFSLGFSTEWNSGIWYSVGDEVTYSSQSYECTYAHTSQSDWYPGAPGLWFWAETEENSGVIIPDWNVWVSYSVGDEVTHEDIWYECVFSHSSQENWYPEAPGIWFWESIPDSDGDGVYDRIENCVGTDIYDNTSKPAVLSGGTWVNKTGAYIQRVSLDYSHYSHYSTCTDIEVTFPINSIQGENLAAVQLVDQNEPPTALPPGLYNPDYSYQEICCTSFRSGETVEFPFVLSDELQHFPGTALKLYHYNGGSGSWEEVEITRIENKAVYAEVTETGYYVVASYQNVIKVDPSEDIVVGVSYKELSSALQYLIVKHVADGNAADRYEVHVEAKLTPYVCDGQFIPANTKILGGYDFSRSNMPDAAANKTYIKPGSTTKAALIGGNKDYFFTDAANHYTDFEKTIIDGFIFNGEDNMNSVVTAPAGAVFICGAWHVRDIRFRNCVFTENKGTMGGAVFVNNGSLIFFDNCVFTGNVSTAGGVLEAPVCNNVTCRDDLVMDNFSGGAATIFEFEGCGSEVEFHSCVFYSNETKFTGYTGTAPKLGGTVAIYGGAGEGRPVKIVNSTFTKNTVTGAATGSARSVYSGDFETMTGTPVVLMNNILHGNTGPAVEVAGITESDVTYKTNIRTAYTADPPAANDYTVAGISYCDIEGFSGTNPTNINDAPEFEDDADDQVMGSDGSWLTADDGLNVKFSSSVRKKAKHDVLPEQIASAENDYYRDSFVDAAKRTRAGYEVAASTFRTDIGAYEKYVKVMCIGDQNTAGYTNKKTRVFISYRNHLEKKAKDSKIEIEFVGGNSDEHGRHEGYADKKVEWFYGAEYDIEEKLSSYKPEALFLMVGTENVSPAVTADQIFEKLYNSTNPELSLVGKIIASPHANDLKVFIGSVPPIDNDMTISIWTGYNEKITTTTNWSTIDSRLHGVDIDKDDELYKPGTGNEFPYTYKKEMLTSDGYNKTSIHWNNSLKAEY